VRKPGEEVRFLSGRFLLWAAAPLSLTDTLFNREVLIAKDIL